MQLILALLATSLGLATLAVSLWILRKVARIDSQYYLLAKRRDLDHLYTQVEALHALHRDLRFVHSLPPLRGFAGSPDFLRVLADRVRTMKPRFVLELGSGSSTLVIARALSLSGTGHVVSLDHDAEYAEQTRRTLEMQGLQDFATVVHAPLREHSIGSGKHLWYSTDHLPRHEYELLVVDGPPTATQPLARYPALPILSGCLSRNFVAIADDADRDDEQEMIRRWLREFPGLEQRDLRCEKGCVELIMRA